MAKTKRKTEIIKYNLLFTLLIEIKSHLIYKIKDSNKNKAVKESALPDI
jgi:hypothetical protein